MKCDHTATPLPLKGRSPVYALVDCNNFYCSCERVFRPDLLGKPMVVLSNNDGCIIARSNEAKKLGVQMGAPFYKHKQFLAHHGVSVFSSNYALYGDLSARVMEVLSQFSPDMEVYSIDEAFLRLDGFAQRNINTYMQQMRKQVLQWTGIPVSVGIGPTKTLAKIASRIGKKNPVCNGVYSLMPFCEAADTKTFSAPEIPAHHPASETTRPDSCLTSGMDAILEHVEVGDVWGVGRRYAKKLAQRGITNARQLRDMPTRWVRENMTIQGVHTVLELRGIPCLELEHAPPPRKSVLSSRSFGIPVTQKRDAQEAVAAYTARAANKLRRDGLEANGVGVYITTNKYRPGPQYSRNEQRALLKATAYTPHLIATALAIFEDIFRAGYAYQKVGVLLFGLEGAGRQQHSLLEYTADAQSQRQEQTTLMRLTDTINERMGRGTIQFAAEGLGRPWQMKQKLLSPSYTVNWEELPIVLAR